VPDEPEDATDVEVEAVIPVEAPRMLLFPFILREKSPEIFQPVVAATGSPPP
jgi:hypothetical protein